MILFDDTEIFDEIKPIVSVCPDGHLSGRLFRRCPVCKEKTEHRKVHFSEYLKSSFVNSMPVMEISSEYLIKYGLEKSIAERITGSDIAQIVLFFRKGIESQWVNYCAAMFPGLRKKYTSEQTVSKDTD